jgi:hypothetical protein
LTNWASVAARTFWRIVATDPPTAADFESEAAQGKPPRSPAPLVQHVHDSISVWATEQQARNRLRAYSWLGHYLARLRADDAAGMRWERTFRPRGHYTLWAPPEELLATVEAVVAV